jgi:hypothetical protein
LDSVYPNQNPGIKPAKPRFPNYSYSNNDGFVKSPSAALRFTFVAAAYLVSTPHSSGFARLAYGAFYFAIPILTFYETVNNEVAILGPNFYHNKPRKKNIGAQGCPISSA